MVLQCSICLENESRYTCPKCSTKTCSLTCVKLHKSQSDCDGLPSSTDFIKRETFRANEHLVQRDYNFLQSIDRNISIAKSDVREKNKRILQVQSHHHQNNKKRRREDGIQEEGVAVRRGVHVKFLPKGMERSIINKSGWDKRRDTFVWTVEFLLLGGEGEEVEKYVSYRVPEGHTVKDSIPQKIRESMGESEWWCWLKKVNVTGKQFVPVNKDAVWADVLRDETVIEFPTIIMTLKGTVKGYKAYENVSEPDDTSDSSSDSDSSNSSEDASDSDVPEVESSKMIISRESVSVEEHSTSTEIPTAEDLQQRVQETDSEQSL